MTPKLYTSLARWWPLLSPPADYAEEAAIYQKYLQSHPDRDRRLSLLELGSGGGNNASFLKHSFTMTLSDVSPQMLVQSRALNPDCEHILGDMRTLRLNRLFDRVFIHDAICYMTTIEDLSRAIETAFLHCRPGGLALFAPDWVRETFNPGTEHGGSDGREEGLRYLEWTWDPDPHDSQYLVDYIYALRHPDGSLELEHDRHVEGIFSRQEWLQVLRDAGFAAYVEPVRHSEVDYPLVLFVGIKSD